MSVVSRLARAMLGPTRYGSLLYRRHPALGRAWGGPMNGQAGRCKLVADLITRGKFAAIVETGTYRGTTTEWLSAFGLPIYSCEADPVSFGFSRERLRGIAHVTLLPMDSRTALRTLFAGPLVPARDSPLLFYLDAHWRQDLPLADEMEIIFSSSSRPVVLIDDFQTPGDAGYSFDDYGTGKALVPRYVQPHVDRFDLACWYPSTPSCQETGAKRGCVVMARCGSELHALVSASLYLRAADPS